MNERPRKAARLTVSLEEQDYEALDKIARARDASISWVIRQAIRQFIETSSGLPPSAMRPGRPPENGK